VVHAEVQLSMDCRIKSGNDEHKIVLAVHLRPSCAHHHASKDSPSREKAEGGGAPKGASNQCPRGAIRCCHLNVLRARCPRRGARQSDRTLRLSPGRASREGEDAGVSLAVDRA
jgi:hypothetical protein